MSCMRNDMSGFMNWKFWSFSFWKYSSLFLLYIGTWDPYSGGNQMYESQLHGVQISTNQGSSLAQSEHASLQAHRCSMTNDKDVLWAIWELSEPYLLSTQIFYKRMPPEAVDLVSRLLQYSPNLRCNAVSIFYLCTVVVFVYFFFFADAESIRVIAWVAN